MMRMDVVRSQAAIYQQSSSAGSWKLSDHLGGFRGRQFESQMEDGRTILLVRVVEGRW